MADTPALIDVRGLTFTHRGESRPTVSDVSFRIPCGRTLGILGYNECGKTTLMRLLLGTYSAQAGTIRVAREGGVLEDEAVEHAAEPTGADEPWAWVQPVRLVLGGACASAALLGATSGGDAAWRALALAAAMLVVALALPFAAPLSGHLRRRRAARGPARRARTPIAHITSEDSPGQRLPAGRPIEEILTAKMADSQPRLSTEPARAGRAETAGSGGGGKGAAGGDGKARKRRAALEYLRRAGFQMYDDKGRPWGSADEYFKRGLTAGQLSGGQRHLMYVLSELAARPRILVCDEMLVGLDLMRKGRMLRLLRQQQREDGAAVLYLTVDFAAAHIVSDELAFMKDGVFLEGPGPARRLLDYPKHSDFKQYVKESTVQEGMARGQHLRAEYARLEREDD